MLVSQTVRIVLTAVGVLLFSVAFLVSNTDIFKPKPLTDVHEDRLRTLRPA